MIYSYHIFKLFDDLWPRMHSSEFHKNNCLNKISSIKACFDKHIKDFDNLLRCLNGLDGVGLTIASGLIWSVYSKEAVPFDKYTMSFCIWNKILNSPKISTGFNYSESCNLIIDYCNTKGLDIEQFVLDAECIEEIFKTNGIPLCEPT